MKSIYGYAALVAATLVAAAPAQGKGANNASSIADAGAQAALQSALAQQNGQQNNQNNNNNQNNQQAQQLAQEQAQQQAAQLAAQQSGLGSGQDLVTQLLLDQSALCGVSALSGVNSLAASSINNVVLFNGIEQAELQALLPFFAEFSGNGLQNDAFVNSALLNLNNVNQLQGGVFDQNLGLQAVQVLQGSNILGVAPMLSGLQINQGIPIIQNDQIVQILSLEQAIEQQIAFEQLLQPILLNGELVQIVPISNNVLLASQSVLGNLNLVQGAGIGGLGLNLNFNQQVWNLQGNQFNNQNLANLGVLSGGVANIQALELSSPFFIQSSSLLGNNDLANLALSAPTFGSTAFLLANQGNVNFNQLSQLGVQQAVNVPFNGGFRK